MEYYVVTYTHTKIIPWAIFLYPHIRYLKKLVKEGKLLVSGPGVGTPVRSAQLVFKVKDEGELNNLLAEDPFSVRGLVATSTINRWKVKWGSMENKETSDGKAAKYFRVTYTLDEGTALSDGEESNREYAQKLLDQKQLCAAGSYVNDKFKGLLILSVDDMVSAEKIMEASPLVKDFGASYQIIEWNPLYGKMS